MLHVTEHPEVRGESSGIDSGRQCHHTGLRSAFGVVALAGLAMAFATSAHAADRFLLDTPDVPPVRSTAVLTGDSLTITDATGKSYLYARAVELDTPDGRYFGYYSRGVNQTLRWPSRSTGKFLIGDSQGQNFRESRMTIQPAGDVDPAVDPAAPPAPRNGRKPVVPPPPPAAPGAGRPLPRVPNAPPPRGNVPAPNPDDFAGRRINRTPAEIALLPGANDTLTAAYIDRGGRLQMFQGWNDTWRRRQWPIRTSLVAGAPLALQPDPAGGLPSVYTVGRGGELLMIAGGEEPRRLTDRATFVAGAHLVVGGTPRFPTIIAVDQRGSIWEIALADGQANPIEANPDRYTPGAPLASVAAGGEQELFAIDRQGTLVNYRKTNGRWDGPDAIARGFAPSGRVAATLSTDDNGQPELLVASADAQGQLQMFRATQNGWNQFALGEQIPLPPGTPLSVVRAADGVHLSAVTRDGTWLEWVQGIRGFAPRVVGRGFAPGAPVVLYPHDLHIHGLSIDAAGRMVAGSFDREWSSVLLVPEFDLAPRLVRREVIPGEALPPANINLENRHNEEIVVHVIDELAPATPTEIRIGPGQSSRQQVKRDPGAILEEVWMIPDANGNWTEDIRRTPLPAPPRYRVVLYANRTTYAYVDKRKKPGPVKDFDIQTPVSLGTFRLPPGAELQDGDTFDVYREAVMRQNPGAAALVDPLRP
jgi:hypothetical protein